MTNETSTDDERAAAREALGWKRRELPGFIHMAGPLWTLREGDGWAYGFLAEARHLNAARVMHGGALVTLIDHAISSVAWESSDRRACVTVQLDTHFLAAARAGDFIEARAEVRHRTHSLLFMQGTLRRGDEALLHAQAVMKIVAPSAD